MTILEKPIEDLYGVCPNCGTKILCSKFEILPKDKNKKEKRHIRCPHCFDTISSLKKVKVFPRYSLLERVEKIKSTYKIKNTEYIITRYCKQTGYTVSLNGKVVFCANNFNQLQIYFAELQLKQSDK